MELHRGGEPDGRDVHSTMFTNGTHQFSSNHNGKATSLNLQHVAVAGHEFVKGWAQIDAKKEA